MARYKRKNPDKWNRPARPTTNDAGMSVGLYITVQIAAAMAADPTWSVMTDEEWADKVIKRTDALIKKLEES